MGREYLKPISDAVKSLVGEKSLPELKEDDKSPEPTQEPIDLSDIMHAATEHFTHIPEFGDEKYSEDGRYEIFSLDGHAPFRLYYRTSRPRHQPQLVPEGAESLTWAHGLLEFIPDASLDDFEGTITKVANEYETDNLTVLDDRQTFPNLLAEFYLAPEEIDEIPEIHEDAARMANEVYTGYVEAIISELEEAEYIPGALEKDKWDDEYQWNLTDAEWQYRNAASNYAAQFPFLVKKGVYNGFLTSEELHKNRKRLE